MAATLSVGELYERLVVDPPRGYAEFYQEVKDLLKLAKDDFPKPEEGDYAESRYGDITLSLPTGALEMRLKVWYDKWFGTSIERVKLNEDV